MPASLPSLIDNSRVSLSEVIRKVAPDYKKLSIATGYWDLEGTLLIFDLLKEYDEVRLLIGREPLIKRYKQTAEPDFPELDFFKDLESLLPTDELRNLTIGMREMIEQGRLKVKVWKKSFLHAKSFIFGDYDSDSAVGIIGSSNFTKAGLTANTELNALEDNAKVVIYKPQTETQEVGHLAWFDQFWNDEGAVNWDGKFSELLGLSPTGTEIFSPYELYIKTLYEMFSEELEEEGVIEEGTKLMPYQIRNVHMLLRKLNKKKVAMLADSVGLGKTATAVEVIKQYRKNQDKKKQRIEVIVPAALKHQWTVEMAKFGLASDGIPVTAFQNEKALKERQSIDKWASVSLFVIDESHNLRNLNSQRFEWVHNWIEANPEAHVLLLTATPINNQISDLTNQILLGAKGDPNIAQVVYDNNGKVEVKNFTAALKTIEAALKRARSSETEMAGVYERMKRIIREVIGQFIVRNTRSGILNDPDFKGSFPVAVPVPTNYRFSPDITGTIVEKAKKFGKDFEQYVWFDINAFTSPDRPKKAIHPLEEIYSVPTISMDERELQKKSPIFFVYQLIMLLGFIPYRWKIYQEKYYGKTYEEIFQMKLDPSESLKILAQLSIYGMLRVSYLKRLESSVFAIRKSILKYQGLLALLEKSINEKNQLLNIKKPELAIEYLQGHMIDDESMQLLDPVDIDASFKKEELLRDLQRDKEIISVVLEQLEVIEKNDAKIIAFENLLKELSEKNQNGGKVLVFSFFSDTVDYLKEKLLASPSALVTELNAGFVSGKNKDDAGSLAGRFSPNAKEYKLEEDETELQYLFATDVLSEGQNLQDCGVIVNYDLHWNPVRMIQRNGRINRLGSQHKEVYIHNLFPADEIDQYLGLVKRLESKIEVINFCVGLDQPVLTDKFDPVEFVDDIKKLYSTDAAEAYNKLEQSTDIFHTEDSFVQELRHFLKSADPEQRQKVLERLPMGKWGAQPNEPFELKGGRPSILISSKLFALSKEGEPIDLKKLLFVKTDNEGNEFSQVDPLIALQVLRANSTSLPLVNEMEIAKYPRKSIAENTCIRAMEIVQWEQSTSQARELRPSQMNLVKMLADLGYPEDDWMSVRKALEYVANAVRERELLTRLREFGKDCTNVEKAQRLIAYSRESLEAIVRGSAGNVHVENIIPMIYSVS